MQVNKTLEISETDLHRLWSKSVPDEVRSKWKPKPSKAGAARNLLYLLPAIGYAELKLPWGPCTIHEYVIGRVCRETGLRPETLKAWRDGDPQAVRTMKAITGILRGIGWKVAYIQFVLDVPRTTIAQWAVDYQFHPDKYMNNTMAQISFELVRYAISARDKKNELRHFLESYLLLYRAVCKVAEREPVNINQSADKEMYIRVMMALLRHYGWTIGQIGALRACKLTSVRNRLTQFDLRLCEQEGKIFNKVVSVVEDKRDETLKHYQLNS